MDLKKSILQSLQKKGRATAAEFVRKTGLSRNYVHRFFKQLQDEGKIFLLGKANQAHYVLANSASYANYRKNVREVRYVLENKDLQEDKILERIKKTTGILRGLSGNITGIFDYAFTEMLNNAIEHSLSRTVEIKAQRLPGGLYFTVSDRGVGIFKNIMSKKALPSLLDAVGELIKGKQTTAPEAHSGEGIFFTSKVADRLVIKSGSKRLTFDNLLDDVAVGDGPSVKGTKVYFAISLTAKRKLEDIFRQYSNDAFEFSKTEVKVKLFQTGQEYVSRSQARRILSGLDSFETLILDFSGINSVGQAFADEIFRVWKNHFPKKNIIVRHSSENVDFMIKRAQGKADAS